MPAASTRLRSASCFSLQHEHHPLHFLLGLLLRLDGELQRVGQLQVAQQHVLHDDAARRDLAPRPPVSRAQWSRGHPSSTMTRCCRR